MVEVKLVQILFLVFISLQVLIWCVVGEEEGTKKPVEKDDGGKWSWFSGAGNRAWGGYTDFGSGPSDGGPTHCGADNGCGISGGMWGGAGGEGYVHENGGGNCDSNGHIGAGGGYGVGIGVGVGVGEGGGYGIGVRTGKGGGSNIGAGEGYGGGIGAGGGGGRVVGNNGGVEGVGVGGRGNAGGGNGGYGIGIGGGRDVGNGKGEGGGGVGIGVGVGVAGSGGGGGSSGGFVIPGVSGQPYYCTPLSCTNGPCNRFALYLGIEPVHKNQPHPSTQENNNHDHTYQNVNPGTASEVDGESSNDQKEINGEEAEHDALHQDAISPASG